MATAGYKIFLESWTVKDAIRYLRSGRKFKIPLCEAVGKLGKDTNVSLIDIVGHVKDRALFTLYEDYREGA